MAMNRAVILGSEGLEEAPLPAVREVLIDFGPAARKLKVFTIVDPDVTINSLILVNHSAKAAPGRDQDENEMDTLLLRAVPGTGSLPFTLKRIRIVFPGPSTSTTS
mgnify:CR=1 FL=1